MANQVTLDDIIAAAHAKYASYDIVLSDGDVASLRNPLRMGQDERKKLSELNEKLGGETAEGEEVDQQELLEDAIRLVIGAKNKVQATKLLKQAGGDLSVLAQIFEGYTGGQQTGEASASAS